jgi:hypothetical protein
LLKLESGGADNTMPGRRPPEAPTDRGVKPADPAKVAISASNYPKFACLARFATFPGRL